MHVRVIALALPLAMGIACTHTRSERSAQVSTSGQTGQTASNQQGQAGAEHPGQTASNQATSEPSNASQGVTGRQEPSSESEVGRSGSTGSSATAGTDTSGFARDPIMENDNDPAKAHADDEVVSGRIARVSRRMLVIDSETGDQKTLFLAPETAIQIDGQDAQRSELQQGQDVRASFNEVDGRPIAVKVRVGQGAASGSSSSAPSTGSGSWSTPGQGTGTVTPPPDDPSSSGNPDTSPEAPNSGGSTGPR
jgi:colicin import membrane protein